MAQEAGQGIVWIIAFNIGLACHLGTVKADAHAKSPLQRTHPPPNEADLSDALIVMVGTDTPRS
jgi:hypothetical protein